MAMQLGGVIAAVLTPLNDDLSPDFAEHVAHCQRLLDEGCDGLSPLGTSGEGNSFSVGERIAIVESLLGGGLSPDIVLPGTGASSLPDTIELTRHALSVGITSVLMVPPFYYKNVSEEGLYAGFARVVEGVADDRLRVVLYHIPPVTAVPIGYGLVARLREAFPGIFAGVKDSSMDFGNMSGYVDRFPGFAVLSGGEPLVKPILEYGGAGSITGCSNIVAPDLAFVTKHFADPAKSAEVLAAHHRLAKTRATVIQKPNIAVMKALLARRTGKSSWRNVRPPLVPLDDAAVTPIADQLAGLRA
jgi:4-hydroxy-tetrahydrodipicolinate synthase